MIDVISEEINEREMASSHCKAEAVLDNWAVLCQNMSSGICGHRRPRSACASAQSDQGLHCPLTESFDTTECMNGEQRPG